MKTLSENYLSALRLHGEQGLEVHLQMAQQLGATAVGMGVGTLEFAKIHQAALEAILSSPVKGLNAESTTRRATIFFNEAVTPIEKTHRSAVEAANELQRTKEFADSKLQVERSIKQRKLSEETLHTSEETCSQLLKKSRILQKELRLLSRRLLSVQEEERKRISRELHDLIGQTLTGINLQLAILKSKTISDAKEFDQKIEHTQQLIEESVDTVYRFARNLRPAVLDDLGLIPALQSYLKGFMQDTGIRVSFTAFVGVEKLNNATRTMLYRVVQEALANVAHHAKASRAEVKLQRHQDTMCMEIHDDGIGFQVDRDAYFGKQSDRLGLLGMRERVEMVDGKFRVESAPGKETTVFVEIPYHETNPKNERKIEAP